MKKKIQSIVNLMKRSFSSFEISLNSKLSHFRKTFSLTQGDVSKNCQHHHNLS